MIDGLDVWLADCPAGAAPVGARCEAVIASVRRASSSGWPEIDVWKRRLPPWFTAACVDDREVQNCVVDRWSLRAWLHWLHPDNRRWEWVDATPVDRTTLHVRVRAVQRPYLKGALEWLVKAAGGGDLRPS